MMFQGLLATLLGAVAADKLDGSYEGSVPFIIDVTYDFDGSDKTDADINIKVAGIRITCPGEDIAEDDTLVTFPSTGKDGDCLGDGARENGQDPSKYKITKNSDGTLTYTNDGYPDLKLTKKSLMANDKLSGSYEGSVPFIIDVTYDFDGSDKTDADINIKVAGIRITCPGEDIAEDDTLVTFPSTGKDGDCLGDGARENGQDPSKYKITKNSDGTLTYTNDGYPDLKLTKKSLMANDKLSGSYEGSVPFIIDVTYDFDGSDKADADINIKVAGIRITCPGEDIAEDDTLVTFPSTGKDGDCLGDGARENGQDPSKYKITKNSDGTLTYTNDGYPDLKLTPKAIVV